MAIKLNCMWTFNSSLEISYSSRRKQMDVDFILFSCQNNERNNVQGTAKTLNTAFWFKVQEGILPLCSALESPMWGPMSNFRQYTSRKMQTNFRVHRKATKIISLNISHIKKWELQDGVSRNEYYMLTVFNCVKCYSTTGRISPFSTSKDTKPRSSRLKLQQEKSDQTLGKGSLMEG